MCLSNYSLSMKNPESDIRVKTWVIKEAEKPPVSFSS